MTDQITLDFSVDLERDRERLKTLAGELGARAREFGVTISDVRIAAEKRDILTGFESPARMKQLNLGSIMAAAGLVASNRYRRSDVARSHRNLNVVWTLEAFAEGAA